MTYFQEKLYGNVNGPFADRLQNKAARRALVLATLFGAAWVGVAFSNLEDGFWWVVAAAIVFESSILLLIFSLRGIFELKDDLLDEYQISVRNNAYKASYGLVLVFLLVVATIAAGMELPRYSVFGIAVFAFLVSALAPRLISAWNLEDDRGQQ